MPDIVKKTPMRHQAEGNLRAGVLPAFYFLYDRGTGKTGTAMLNLDQLIEAGAKRVLYIAPLSTLENVEREAYAFASRLRPRTIFGTRDERERLLDKPGDRNVDILNFEAVRILYDTLARQKYDVLVVDEASRIKDRDSQVTKAVVMLGRSARWRRCLAGWPFTEGVENAWSQYDFLQKGLFSPSFFAFCYRYCEFETETIPVRDPKTKKVIYLLEPGASPPPKERLVAPSPKAYALRDYRKVTYYVQDLTGFKLQRHPNGRPAIVTRDVKKIVGVKNLEEFAQKIAPITHRVEKKDCLDLPPITRTTLKIPMLEEQARLYAKVEKESRTVLGDIVVDHGTALGRMTKLRQIASGFLYGDEGKTAMVPTPKYAELSDLLGESLISKKDKAVVFTAFKAEPEMVKEVLLTAHRKMMVFLLPENPRERQSTIDLWQAWDQGPAVIVANVASGGVGLNLQAAHTAVFFSNDWKAELRGQAIDRIYRYGSDQHTKISVYDLVMEGTVEETVLDALDRKVDVIEAFLVSMKKSS